ncbi:MAG: ribosome small subunit-dependent GTPase A [Bacilli bacterium]|nr:ribosome small subunit-dependent GTPase A [Bacilli bacterium]
MEGRIIKNISNDYVVKIDNELYTCKPRGKFRISNLTPLVGDIVEIDNNNNYIIDIKKRKNSLIRPSVSNIDKAIIVTSVKPKLDTNLLDKLLVLTMYNNIEPVICFTKLDLLNLEELKEINSIINYYESIGYVAVKNTQIDKIKSILKNNLSVFVGQSGAGKSSLLNKLDSKLELKTNEISKALGRGKHTTRHVELFEVCEGLVVDTPGFSSLDLSSLSNIDIRDNMKEMFDNLDKCKYRDCMHYKEDGCYVKSLVDDNVILKSRYDNYISFLRK